MKIVHNKYIIKKLHIRTFSPFLIVLKLYVLLNTYTILPSYDVESNITYQHISARKVNRNLCHNTLQKVLDANLTLATMPFAGDTLKMEPFKSDNY